MLAIQASPFRCGVWCRLARTERDGKDAQQELAKLEKVVPSGLLSQLCFSTMPWAAAARCQQLLLISLASYKQVACF